MFTLLNTVLLIVLIVQVVKLRNEVVAIDCPAAKELKKLRNPIRSLKNN